MRVRVELRAVDDLRIGDDRRESVPRQRVGAADRRRRQTQDRDVDALALDLAGDAVRIDRIDRRAEHAKPEPSALERRKAQDLAARVRHRFRRSRTMKCGRDLTLSNTRPT